MRLSNLSLSGMMGVNSLRSAYTHPYDPLPRRIIGFMSPFKDVYAFFFEGRFRRGDLHLIGSPSVLTRRLQQLVGLRLVRLGKVRLMWSQRRYYFLEDQPKVQSL
ncbi:UNVERIFIED_CONTAM: hypothetical protein Sindi_2632300 [Sesamum indicum]